MPVPTVFTASNYLTDNTKAKKLSVDKRGIMVDAQRCATCTREDVQCLYFKFIPGIRTDQYRYLQSVVSIITVILRPIPSKRNSHAAARKGEERAEKDAENL